MSSNLNLDIEVAAAKDLLAKPVPIKPIQRSKNDVDQLNRQIQERKKAALQTQAENLLRDNEVRAQVIQQKRLEEKQVVFRKYCRTIQGQLEVLKLEMQNIGQYHFPDQGFYSLMNHWLLADSKYKLQIFQRNLSNIRTCTCSYKFCCPNDMQACLSFWCLCWLAIPFYCCYRKLCCQSISQVKLRELYEKYELIIEEELVRARLGMR